jgi:hypothetical protein
MKYIFITGMGRSGTKFVASVLDSLQDADARHEYIGDKECTLLSWYLPEDVYAVSYLRKIKQ